MSTEVVENMDQQLRALYEERELLHDRFGVSSADEITAMVENLEAQLRDFYGRFGEQDSFDDAETTILLSKIKDLGKTLDPMYSRKSVHFAIVNDKPTLRAEWTEHLHNEGDNA